MYMFLLACLKHPLSGPLSVFLSSLWAVSYAARLSRSQQCVADTEEKEKRPSGLGHSVAATTRDAARTPLQTIITVRVGRNNDSGYGKVSPLYLQWCSFFLYTPLSGSHSFFTPLEIVLLTWVDNSFFVLPRLFTLCLCASGLASFKRKAVYLHRVNIWERAFCCFFERAASRLTIVSIPIGTNSGLCTFTDKIS